ncbi:hypothetical protein EOD39_7222, partial [Acipenser ruthenus]
RLFFSSLQFLIQQHLDLLRILQDRVLKCQWQGIMGDIFMKLTSKEGEAPGDEHQPSLHSLLLQPVRRVPEYLSLLQNLLKHTDPEHPDYHLLLICIQQLQSFLCQSSHLLQHNEALLTQDMKDLKRPDTERRSRSPPLQVIPETELESGSLKHLACNRSSSSPQASSKSIADYDSILLREEALGLESPYEEDRESLQNASLFDNCSTASLDSSLDITFISTKNYTSESCVLDYHKSGRTRFSPEDPGSYRHTRKSKSLNGLQLESTCTASDADNLKTAPGNSLQSNGSGGSQHTKLETAAAKGPAAQKPQRSLNPHQKWESKNRAAAQEESSRGESDKLFPD